jgi:hypothetical protein
MINLIKNEKTFAERKAFIIFMEENQWRLKFMLEKEF